MRFEKLLSLEAIKTHTIKKSFNVTQKLRTDSAKSILTMNNKTFSDLHFSDFSSGTPIVLICHRIFYFGHWFFLNKSFVSFTDVWNKDTVVHRYNLSGEMAEQHWIFQKSFPSISYLLLALDAVYRCIEVYFVLSLFLTTIPTSNSLIDQPRR